MDLDGNIKTNTNNRYREFTISVDFDDTIAEAHNFPEIGDLKHEADIYINKMYDAGYNIIINTCRTDDHQSDAEKFLKEKGIKYHHINCNLPANIEFFNQDCRKISADVYIDDRCVMGLPETWEEIYNLVELKAKKYYGREENVETD